jgi:hypothetical protein
MGSSIMGQTKPDPPLAPPPPTGAPQLLIVHLQLQETLLQVAQKEAQLLGLCSALLLLAALLSQHEDDLWGRQVAMPQGPVGPQPALACTSIHCWGLPHVERLAPPLDLSWAGVGST